MIKNNVLIIEKSDVFYCESCKDDENIKNYARQIGKIEKAFFNPPWSESEILSSINQDNYIFILFIINQNVAGYGSFSFVLDEGYINNIAVKEEYQNEKIGSKILKQMILVAKEKNLSFLSLEVRKTNTKAICLYEKYNFVKAGIRKNFYHNPQEDGFIMTLNLK